MHVTDVISHAIDCRGRHVITDDAVGAPPDVIIVIVSRHFLLIYSRWLRLFRLCHALIDAALLTLICCHHMPSFPSLLS